jgi:hypothetical protein
MFIGPRMTFRLEITNLLRQLIENELPKQPADKSVEFAAELFAGADGTVHSTNLRLKYEGATQSFAPLP